MISQEFVCPEFVTLSDTLSIASALGCPIEATTAEPINANVLIVQRSGHRIAWITRKGRMVFGLNAVAALGVSRVSASGEEFTSFDITFVCGQEPLKYALITAHITMAEWLDDVASRISALFGRQLDHDKREGA